MTPESRKAEALRHVDVLECLKPTPEQCYAAASELRRLAASEAALLGALKGIVNAVGVAQPHRSDGISPRSNRPGLRECGMSGANLGAWGRDDLMAVAAVRYCLGRTTYITSDCSEWLAEQWPNIKPNARTVIQRDIEEAFKRDDDARANGEEHKPLGWDCDRSAWAKVRELWSKT